MQAIENEYYEFKDIFCLLLDMFDKKENYFVIEDFLSKYYFSANFFNLLTNYVKCVEFLQKDSNFTPVVPKFTEWVNFANAAYGELVYGAIGDQPEDVILSERPRG